jgi:hypothetical protein
LDLNNPSAGERTSNHHWISTIHQLVKGHPITIGQIFEDFVASCNGKIVEILTHILHFLKKELSSWAEEMS